MTTTPPEFIQIQRALAETLAEAITDDRQENDRLNATDLLDILGTCGISLHLGTEASAAYLASVQKGGTMPTTN